MSSPLQGHLMCQTWYELRIFLGSTRYSIKEGSTDFDHVKNILNGTHENQDSVLL